MGKRKFQFWVYILSSRSKNLYVGMTNDLIGRTEQHREQTPGAHTARYNIHRLVYFEYFQYVRNAIAREKDLKRLTREQKIALIEQENPTWDDLYPQLTASEQQIPFGDDNKKDNSKDQNKTG
ncbi:MAG TPA: GIY-YIG nuclease family protein [Acidobacteriaceae bacterium]|jgi:putative endonuclease